MTFQKLEVKWTFDCLGRFFVTRPITFFLLTGLVAKIDPFSVFWKVISRKPLDLLYIVENVHRFFQALSASVPNFIEIGVLANLVKTIVDLTRNDPANDEEVTIKK